MLKRHKISRVTVAIALAIVFGASLTAAPAAAKPAAAGVPAQAQVTLAVCNYVPLCVNRAGGGRGIGASVIGWSKDFDTNEDFQLVNLYSMCNGGLVSANEECPFTPGGGLNKKYNDRPIDIVKAYNENLCVATNANGKAVLNLCPDHEGNGGANGTIMVYSNQSYLVNRYWSNNPAGGNGTSPNWMCVGSRGDQIILDYPFGTSNICQWQEYAP